MKCLKFLQEIKYKGRFAGITTYDCWTVWMCGIYDDRISYVVSVAENLFIRRFKLRLTSFYLLKLLTCIRDVWDELALVSKPQGNKEMLHIHKKKTQHGRLLIRQRAGRSQRWVEFPTVVSSLPLMSDSGLRLDTLCQSPPSMQSLCLKFLQATDNRGCVTVGWDML